MLNVSEYITHTALKDPGRVYDTPRDVLNDSRLGFRQKQAVLKSWEEDQLALLRAEAEAMTQCDGSSSPIRMLEQIEKALRELELH